MYCFDTGQTVQTPTRAMPLFFFFFLFFILRRMGTNTSSYSKKSIWARRPPTKKATPNLKKPYVRESAFFTVVVSRSTPEPCAYHRLMYTRYQYDLAQRSPLSTISESKFLTRRVVAARPPLKKWALRSYYDTTEKLRSSRRFFSTYTITRS